MAALAYALLFAVFARSAGVEAVGAVGIVASISSFVAILADSGLASLVSKARAHRDDALTAAALRLNGITCTFIGAVMSIAVAGWATLSGRDAVLGLIALSSTFEMSTETCLAIPIADDARGVPAQSLLIRRLGAAAIFGVLVKANVGATPAYCVGLASAALLGQLHARTWIRRNGQLDQSSAHIRSALRESIPYSVSNLSGAVRYLDTFVVGVMTTPFSAGLYSAAARLVAPMQLVSNSITSVILPHAVRLRRAEAQRLANKMVMAFGVLTVLSLCLAPLMPWAVDALLGDEFRGMVPTLRVLAVGFPVVLLCSPLGAIMQAQDHERFVAINGALFAAVALSGLAVGAMVGGAVGAALALSVTFAMKAASLVWAINMRLGEAVGSERQLAG